MKCPNDQNEMERGYLLSGGMAGRSYWMKDVNFAPFKKGGTAEILFWKCSKCGKVELQAEGKNG